MQVLRTSINRLAFALVMTILARLILSIGGCLSGSKVGTIPSCPKTIITSLAVGLAATVKVFEYLNSSTTITPLNKNMFEQGNSKYFVD